MSVGAEGLGVVHATRSALLTHWQLTQAVSSGARRSACDGSALQVRVHPDL